MKTVSTMLLGLAAFLPGGVLHADLPFTVHGITGNDMPVAGQDYLIFTFASNASTGNRIAFGAFASGAGVNSGNDICIVGGDPAALAVLAREGDLSPTGGGETFTFISSPALNAAGTIVFRSSLGPNPNSSGLFRKVEGNPVETLARNGSIVDGNANLQVSFPILGNRYPVDDGGNGYFIVPLTGTAVTSGTGFGLLRAGTSGVETIARSGVTVPAGVPDVLPAIRYDYFATLDANASGEVAFIAGLTNVTLNDDLGVWRSSNGNLGLLAREGGTAPGLGGATFAQLGSGVGIGDDGTVAFCAILGGIGVTSDNEESIWKGTPGAIELVAREGGAAPELSAGVVFDQLVLLGNIDLAPAVNPKGRIAFLARVRGPGIDDSNNDTLWVQDGNEDLRLVIREGSLVPSGNATDLPIGTSAVNFLPITLDPVDAFSGETRLIYTAETNNGSFDGVYEAEVPGNAVGPTVRISGPKRRTTTRPRLRLSGIAADPNPVVRVEVKVGRTAFKTAAGTTRWRFTARLKTGPNRILARAFDEAGNASAKAAVSVRRR